MYRWWKSGQLPRCLLNSIPSSYLDRCRRDRHRPPMQRIWSWVYLSSQTPGKPAENSRERWDKDPLRDHTTARDLGWEVYRGTLRPKLPPRRNEIADHDEMSFYAKIEDFNMWSRKCALALAILRQYFLGPHRHGATSTQILQVNWKISYSFTRAELETFGRMLAKYFAPSRLSLKCRVHVRGP